MSQVKHPSQSQLDDDDNNENEVVIVSAVRTPICRAKKGGLSKIPPSTLLSTVLSACLDRVQLTSTNTNTNANANTSNKGIEAREIQDICVGTVLPPSSVGHVSCRMAALNAGIPYTVPLYTVNRQCSSGLQAIASIAQAIRSNQISIGIAAGVESMSTHAMNMNSSTSSTNTNTKMDWDVKQCTKEAMDCLIPMGITSENISKSYGLTRTQLDTFAYQSHVKAAKATQNHLFQPEIIPIDIPIDNSNNNSNNNNNSIHNNKIQHDDGIRPNTTLATLSKLPPVFDPQHGSTTAGNSSQISDGAAAVLLMTRNEAIRRNIHILGTWKAYSVVGVPPSIMGIGPAYAIPHVLNSINKSIQDVNVFEINEAFASQALYCIQHLNIPMEKVNPLGGAIALGHPLGCTGVRQVVTLLHYMNHYHRYHNHNTTNKNNNNNTNTTNNNSDSALGVVSMCIGTGMGAAAVLQVDKSFSQHRHSNL